MIRKRAQAVARGLLLVSAMAVAIARPPPPRNRRSTSKASSPTRSRAVLPGATVTLQNVATGLSRETATDANGRYVFTSLPPAGQVRAADLRSTGFATERRENLTFNAGQRAVLNITLKLSIVQETVTVAGDSPVVQTTTAEVTRTIEQPRPRDAAGRRAQLLPSPDARLERRRARPRHQRVVRRRRRRVEFRDLRRWHQQLLEVADAAARAAARVGRFRAGDGRARCRSSPTSSRRSSAATPPA